MESANHFSSRPDCNSTADGAQTLASGALMGHLALGATGFQDQRQATSGILNVWEVHGLHNKHHNAIHYASPVYGGHIKDRPWRQDKLEDQTRSLKSTDPSSSTSKSFSVTNRSTSETTKSHSSTQTTRNSATRRHDITTPPAAARAAWAKLSPMPPRAAPEGPKPTLGAGQTRWHQKRRWRRRWRAQLAARKRFL